MIGLAQAYSILEPYLANNLGIEDTVTDSQTLGFLIGELEAVQETAYEQLYGELNARNFPVLVFGTPADTEYSTSIYDKVGIAELISDWARDLPRADVSKRRYKYKIIPYGNSYGFNLQEIAAAAKLRIPLDKMKGDAARRGFEERLNKTVFTGDERVGNFGLKTNPNISTYTASIGASGSTLWSTKTSAEILSDMHSVVDSVDLQALGAATVTDLWIPRDLYNRVARTNYSSQFPQSILSVFIENTKIPAGKNSPGRPNGVRVSPINEMSGLGSDGGNAMFAWTDDVKMLAVVITEEYRILPPQPKGLEIEHPCYGRIVGLVINGLFSCAKMEGI
jgi:hypothetical protein